LPLSVLNRKYNLNLQPNAITVTPLPKLSLATTTATLELPATAFTKPTTTAFLTAQQIRTGKVKKKLANTLKVQQTIQGNDNKTLD
jgi:hypothetical protein